MITNPSDDAGLQAKLEEQNTEGRANSRALPSSSRQWSSFRNPRIVRVSRTFGGKDRHSKVCTVRGLRDRRIRLSMPTAIQLYDLQDKLGLSQPSKVVDWLLDVTKQDIDKLPPLQMPQGFSQFHPQMFGDNSGSRNLGDLLLPAHESSASQFSLSPFFPTSTYPSFLSKCGIKINDNVDGDGQEAAGAKSAKYWDIDLGLRAKDKDVILQREPLDDEKGKSIDMTELQKHAGTEGAHYAQLSAQNFFPMVGYSSFPSGSATNAMPYSYNQWEPSNLSLSQFGGSLQPQIDNFLHSNSASALPSGSSQLYPCPPTMPSLFPTYPPYFAAPTEKDSRQLNHFQFLSSSSSHQTILPTSFMPQLHLIKPPEKPFQTNIHTKFLHPQEDSQSEDDEQPN